MNCTDERTDTVMIHDTQEGTKVEQLMARVRQRIEHRTLVPGARLT